MAAAYEFRDNKLCLSCDCLDEADVERGVLANLLHNGQEREDAVWSLVYAAPIECVRRALRAPRAS